MCYYVNDEILTQEYMWEDNNSMDENINNNDVNDYANNSMNDNVNDGASDNIDKEETSFGSSEYYKKLYDDFPEDVAEMLIGTHPLMKKEVSDELTHSIKIKSAREKNRKAVAENAHTGTESTEEVISPSKDPVDSEINADKEETIDDYVGDITSFTKGLITSPAGKKSAEKKAAEAEKEPVRVEKEPEEPKSEDDITAEKIAKMLGGVEVEPVEEGELDDFIDDKYEKEEKRSRAKKEEKRVKAEAQRVKAEKHGRRRKKYDKNDLELSNIEKQADLNELFREDDDYYEEKYSGNSVLRIVLIIAGIVVLAFFIYKLASLSGQVSKLKTENESYKTMETEYEQLKLDNLSLQEQVDSLQAQLGGGQTSTDNGVSSANQTNSNQTSNNQSSTTASSTSGSKTYTVQDGDTYWGIATKMYGNGSYYTKILSANGLSENDKLKAGMTLTIPAA